MTPEKLRKFDGLKKVTDEMAMQIIEFLEDFSVIVYKHYLKLKNIKSSDNEHRK